MTWTDKDRKGQVVESRVKCGDFELVVHHYHGCGDQWFLSVHHGPIDQHPLKSTVLGDAKQEAGRLFNDMLHRAFMDLEA